MCVQEEVEVEKVLLVLRDFTWHAIYSLSYLLNCGIVASGEDGGGEVERGTIICS